MKTKLLLYLLSFFFILCIIIYGLLYEYYSPPKESTPYRINKHKDYIIRVAYIGDSWANFHAQYDKEMSKSLSRSLKRPAIVSSFGICGNTSKEIYKALFSDSAFHTFIMKGYDYCIISAGINDTYKKMSASYYAQSMNCIIHFLLWNNVIPIVIEIPEYNISKAYEKQTILKKFIRIISMHYTGTPVDGKNLFRKELNKMISDKNLSDSIIVIKYKQWNANSHNDLKDIYENDGMHLKRDGYKKLDSCIIVTICETFKTDKAYVLERGMNANPNIIME